MTRQIPFTKMHGAGNDYIYVNTMQYPIEEPEKLSIAWSAYHTGIGSDGLVLIGSSNVADFSMRIFNADGSYQDVTSAYDSNATTTLPECAQYIDGHLFCYFEGNSTYSSPNAWIWNDEGSFTGSAWPGTALTEVGSAQNGNKVWLWDGGELPASLPTGVVFNTGTGTPKTIDLEFVNAGYYTPNGLVDVVKKADTLKGDINGDGKVDVSDVTTLVGYILDGETPQNCDLDGDGNVNVTDVTTLVNLILE